MTITAESIVASIATDEKAYNQAPERYNGFIRKIKASSLDFCWKKALPGKADEMTINRHGVICSRSVQSDGRNWYGYTLDPFGPDVPYSVECEAGQRLLRFVKVHAAIKQMRQLTQVNAITEAYLVGAQLLGSQFLVEQFEAILHDQQRRGELSLDAYHKRSGLYQQLKACAQEQLSPEQYQAFYKAT